VPAVAAGAPGPLRTPGAWPGRRRAPLVAWFSLLIRTTLPRTGMVTIAIVDPATVSLPAIPGATGNGG
jgi:hypothetical protein